MSGLSEIAYRLDPVLWVQSVLGVKPAALAGELLARARKALRLSP